MRFSANRQTLGSAFRRVIGRLVFGRYRAPVLVLACACVGGSLWAAGVPLKDRAHLRRPIAGAWFAEGKLLAIANQRSGSVSVVDVKKRKVLSEVKVGDRLADAASLPGEQCVVVVDDERHEVLVLRWEAGELQVVERLPVSRYPVSVAVSPDGSRCTVVSLWTRTITTFQIQSSEDPASTPTLAKRNEATLSFAPGRQLYLDARHVLVADAFTGQLALLDVVTQHVVKFSVKHILRIYGMALSTDRDGFYIGHQTAQPMRMSRRPTEVAGEKGMSLTNLVGQYSITALLGGRLVPYIHDRDAPARVGYFEGDLRQMDDLVPIALSVRARGYRQWLNSAPDETLVRLRRFRDEIVVTARPRKHATIRLGPVGAMTPADRGEAFFYDASLSATGWMSCHSCHPDGHTTGQLVDTLGDGSRRTHKRVLTLLGSGTTGKWAWSGDAAELHLQVLKSLETTMGKRASVQTVKDLTAYVQTLPPPPPLKPASDDPADQAQLARGEAFFKSRGCANCHVPKQGYTSDATYDVGLRDAKGMAQFNPPSLRGVSQGYTFFHDGRAKSLEDVFIEHRHPDGEVIASDDVADLLRFLHSL